MRWVWIAGAVLVAGYLVRTSIAFYTYAPMAGLPMTLVSDGQRLPVWSAPPPAPPGAAQLTAFREGLVGYVGRYDLPDIGQVRCTIILGSFRCSDGWQMATGTNAPDAVWN